MIPAFLELPEHWSGTTFTPVMLDFSYDEEDPDVVAGSVAAGAPVDLTGVYARMTGRDSARNIIFDWFSADHPESVNAFLAPDEEVAGRYWIVGPGVFTSSSFGKVAFDLKFWQNSTRFKYLRGTFVIRQGETV